MRRTASLAAATALVAALALAPAAGSKAKQGKPIKAAASIDISSELVSSSDPQYSLYRFKGTLRTKAACRKDRQVAVAVSMDGGPAAPDNRKGGFTAKDGSWVSVYDVLLLKGHSYTAVASAVRTTARAAQKRYSCRAAESAPLSLAP